MTQDITDITLQEMGGRFHNPEIQYERETAIRDLLQENSFRLIDGEQPPYHLRLELDGLQQMQLHLVSPDDGNPIRGALTVSMRPFQRLIKDYFIIWESYSQALRTAAPEKLQAIDMGRRAIHNEGAELLEKRLSVEVQTDFDTLRRLFTLVCVLHIK